MKAFLTALVAIVVISVASDVILKRAGFSAAEKASAPGSVRLGDPGAE